jgi:hypothetical protein
VKLCQPFVSDSLNLVGSAVMASVTQPVSLMMGKFGEYYPNATIRDHEIVITGLEPGATVSFRPRTTRLKIESEQVKVTCSPNRLSYAQFDYETDSEREDVYHKITQECLLDQNGFFVTLKAASYVTNSQPSYRDLGLLGRHNESWRQFEEKYRIRGTNCIEQQEVNEILSHVPAHHRQQLEVPFPVRTPLSSATLNLLAEQYPALSDSCFDDPCNEVCIRYKREEEGLSLNLVWRISEPDLTAVVSAPWYEYMGENLNGVPTAFYQKSDEGSVNLMALEDHAIEERDTTAPWSITRDCFLLPEFRKAEVIHSLYARGLRKTFFKLRNLYNSLEKLEDMASEPVALMYRTD